jgi:hypothetical protein
MEVLVFVWKVVLEIACHFDLLGVCRPWYMHSPEMSSQMGRALLQWQSRLCQDYLLVIDVGLGLWLHVPMPVQLALHANMLISSMLMWPCLWPVHPKLLV